MKPKNEFIITQEDAGKRLDVFLSEQVDLTRSKIQQIIADDNVLVNGKLPKKAGDTMKIGMKVVMLSLEKKTVEESAAAPVVIPRIRVVAATPEYIVAFKPAGLLTHPTEADEPDTFADQVLALYPEIKGVGEGEERWGIVHRLDKEASGLLVVARTKKMFASLKKQFQDRTIEKEYQVLVHGSVVAEHDILDFPIDRGRDGRMVSRPISDLSTLRGVATQQTGKESVTELVVVKRFTRFTLLSVRIHTGRMHQIRVHMLAYNRPVVGDTLYFNKKLNRKRDLALGRLFLHAGRLCFTDLKEERVCFEEPLPPELVAFLGTLKQNSLKIR